MLDILRQIPHQKKSATKERKGSGFVASNMWCSASDKIQRSVKRILNQNHHEFISCCKLPLDKRLNFDETKIKCHSTWTTYLYKQNKIQNDSSSTTQLCNSVQNALQDNWSPQRILDLVIFQINHQEQNQVIQDTGK